MAFTTLVSGTAVTAAWANASVRDQVVTPFADAAARTTAISAPVEGMVSVLTTLDRVNVYSGSAYIHLESYGTAGRTGVILTDAAQTIATATPTDITWGTEVSDVDGWTSGASATLTVPSGWDGRYHVSFSGIWSATPGTRATVGCFVNGVALYTASGDIDYFGLTLGFMRSLAATDTLKFQALHLAGVNRDIVSRLEIAWIER